MNTGINFLLNNTITKSMYNTTIFLHSSLSFSTHLVQLSTSFCMLSEKRCFWSSDKPHMHYFFQFLSTGEMAASQTVSKWRTQVTVRRSHIRITWRMFQHFKIQVAEAFNAAGGSKQTGITVQHCNTFRQQFSLSGLNSSFQPVPKYFTIMDTVYCCASVLVVFQNWPLCILKKCPHRSCW